MSFIKKKKSIMEITVQLYMPKLKVLALKFYINTIEYKKCLHSYASHLF